MARSNTSYSKVDAGHLEMLGKQAARLSEAGDLSLNDAVVQTVGHEKLSQEQVRRVVEFTNIDAFNRKFASLEGPMRAVHVDGGPADPVHVIQSLNNGARPTSAEIGTTEYSTPPEFGKTSSYVLEHNPERTKKGTMLEVTRLHSKLSAAHEEVTQDLEASKFMMNEALVDLVDRAKRASLQGASAAEIYEAWQRVDADMAKVAFARARLVLSLNQKVAGRRRLNPDHPVVSSFTSFVKAAQSYGRCTTARQSLEGELVRVGTWVSTNGA